MYMCVVCDPEVEKAALQISSAEGPDLVSTENVYVHVGCAVLYSSLRCDAVVCGCGESW